MKSVKKYHQKTRLGENSKSKNANRGISPVEINSQKKSDNKSAQANPGRMISSVLRKQNTSRLLHPMLAKTAGKLINEEDYAFEYKWDGFRCMARVSDDKVELISRNGISFNERFEIIANELQQIKDEVILDGEIVAVNKRNEPEFQLLQNAYNSKTKLRYYIFDLLYINGHILTGMPYLERNAQLNLLFRKYKFKSVYLSEILKGQLPELFAKARDKKLEGIIAKRSNGLYFPGKRTSEWLKIKVFNTQSAMICGFTKPQGGRQKFGSLILGIMNRTN